MESRQFGHRRLYSVRPVPRYDTENASCSTRTNQWNSLNVAVYFRAIEGKNWYCCRWLRECDVKNVTVVGSCWLQLVDWSGTWYFDILLVSAAPAFPPVGWLAINMHMILSTGFVVTTRSVWATICAKLDLGVGKSPRISYFVLDGPTRTLRNWKCSWIVDLNSPRIPLPPPPHPPKTRTSHGGIRGFGCKLTRIPPPPPNWNFSWRN